MPKFTEHPRFRVHTRKGKAGQVWTNYYWDGRARNMGDIALGNDLRIALERWAICEAGGTFEMPPRDKPAPIVKPHKKPLAPRLPGKRRKFVKDEWAGLPMWAKRFYLNAERRAADDRRHFWLTPADIAHVVKRANGRCEVSGIELRERQDGDTERHPHSPSIDRIDSTKGYVAGNIRVVCLIANLAMNTWGEDALKGLADSVQKRHGGNPSAIHAEALLAPTSAEKP